MLHKHHPQLRPLWMFLIYLAIVFIVPAIGAFFQPGDWYSTLLKPEWTPPGAVFAPVWTALYFLMAVSIWLVWSAAPSIIEFTTPRLLFFIQLVLNALWTPLFFGLKSPAWAFVDICFLWVFILAMLYSYSRLSITATLLQIPYFLWVSFAAILNYSIWQINL